MILTPEERRALLSLAGLLVAGQLLAFWQEHRRARPDRELSAWLESLHWARAEADTSLAPLDSAWLVSPLDPRLLTAAVPPAKPDTIPVRGLEAAPAGILGGTRLDLAEARYEDLLELPGVGPSLARAILAEREKGPFATPDDLLRVKGIGPKKLERLRPHVKFPEGDVRNARLRGGDSQDAPRADSVRSP